MQRAFLIALIVLLTSPLLAKAEDTPVTVKETAKEKVPLFREDAGLTKAAAQLREGKYAEGLDTLEDVLKRHPGNADALTYTGFAYLQMQDIEKATQYIDNALIANPRHLGANAYRADLYLLDGDTARALEQLQVMRAICAGMDCAEINAVEAHVNATKHKAGTPAKKADTFTGN